MPGSWELVRRKSVLCAFLHVDVTSVAWSLGLRNLLPPEMAMMPIAGMPYDHGRNVACMKALECGADYLFFLDSDVVPPRDAVLRLMAHDKPLISGMYCRRSPPHAVPVMIKNGTWFTAFRPGEVVEVDLVGAGCLLIRRDLLEKMPPQSPDRGRHWFDWRVDCAGIRPQGDCLSEDFTFCKHVRERMGIPILVDTSVHCKHVGLAQSTLGRFEPCETTPVT